MTITFKINIFSENPGKPKVCVYKESLCEVWEQNYFFSLSEQQQKNVSLRLTGKYIISTFRDIRFC